MVWRTLFYTVLAVVLGARVTSQQDCEGEDVRRLYVRVELETDLVSRSY